MAISFIAAAVSSSELFDTATTAAMNTTGANFLVAAVISGTTTINSAFSDSKGNTWTALSGYGTAADNQYQQIRLFYCIPSSVGSGHTFTYNPSPTGQYPNIVAAAFSGVKTSSCFDAEVGTRYGGANDKTPGSLNPTENNSLLIAACAGYMGASGDPAGATISSPFTKAGSTKADNNYSVLMGYQIQGNSKSTENPTLHYPAGYAGGATMAAFKDPSPSPIVSSGSGFFQLFQN